MRTSEAIALLRQRLDIQQKAFAQMLGITVTSISRYENGRAPSRRVLKKLADVAKDARLNDLCELFTAEWKTSVTARLKNLRSAGTERSVPLDDLQRWHAAPQFIREQVFEALKIYKSMAVKSSDQQRLSNANRLLSGLVNKFLPQVSNSIELYINIPKKKDPMKQTKSQHPPNRPPYESFTKPTCKGCYALGSACGNCERCTWERARMQIAVGAAFAPPGR